MEGAVKIKIFNRLATAVIRGKRGEGQELRERTLAEKKRMIHP